MSLDEDSCYRAMVCRDRRFEGRFVVAVTTSRIYCRPGCPARLPRRDHLRFYVCPAAAEEDDYRPCLRCRPDASPDTPAWAGTSATVSRATRLISEGAMDDGGVEALAERLGVGPRHLRRLFAEHLGASPVSVAQTRRLHFARMLIHETNLPMTEVAFGAGFASLRRFNEAMRQTFRRTPSELRSGRRGSRPARPELALRLPFKAPLDWDALVAYLGERAIPGVEHVGGGSYRRSIRVGESFGRFEVSLAQDGHALVLHVSLPGVSSELMRIVERVRRLFDLRADPQRISESLKHDGLLAPRIAAHPGLRVAGAWDPFELGVRAIVGQQITVRGATTLAGRLVRAFGEPLPAPLAGALTHAFPTPSALIDADLASIGLPRARAASIRSFAAAERDGVLAKAASHPDLEEAVRSLTVIDGIGPWTAQYIALRAFGHPDAFPATDLGLRRAASDGGPLLPVGRLSRRAEAWRPWRAYAAMHLWSQAEPTRRRTKEPA